MLLDIHAHPPRDPAQLPSFLAALERFDSRVLLSELGSRTRGWVHEPEVEHWREGNAHCAELVATYPDRLLGYCYVNPAHTREALEEMERRLLGQPDRFAALKLWVAVRCSDPRLDPLMEFCAAYGVPVLQHTWLKVGDEGPGSGNLPGESTPSDLLALARRHPRVRFFAGHTGGDWEWGVAALKQVENVWLDIAGGEASGGYAELALRAVGAGRIVFGTDVPGRSVPSQLAKLLTLDLPDADLERVLWRNAAEVLGDRLPPAWRQRFLASPARPPSHLASSPAPALSVASAVASTASLPGSPAAAPAVARAQPGAWLPRLPQPDGGYVDANSALGEWPSRRLNGSPPPTGAALVEQRLRLMDARGIRRAAVCSLDAVWLKDCGVANAELHALVGGHPRFFPVYTLNPTFPAWLEHLERCIGDYGLAAGTGAIRLLPSYHGYRLDDPRLEPCLERLAALDLPVILPLQLEDARMHHPAMRVPDLDPAAVVSLLRRWLSLRWIIASAVFGQVQAIGRELSPEARVWFDLSRVQGPIDDVRTLAAELGARRLLFGTNLPLHVAESAMLSLADAQLPPADDAAIRFGNARDALGTT